MHLFLSPHPDDVVLSCGGLLYQLAQRGEQAVVFTIMAGNVPPDAPMTPFIEEHFVRWELGFDPMPGRKREDEQAVQMLGGTVSFGPFPDALYRTDGNGSPLYSDLKTLFGDINPRDPVLFRVSKITDLLATGAVIYAPLGAGHHVDHLLVRDTVVNWKKCHSKVAVFFYEEYPYSANGIEVIQTACETLGMPAIPVIHSLHEAAVEMKINAIACYQSQISTFWTDGFRMGESVREYAAQVGQGRYAERLWQPV